MRSFRTAGCPGVRAGVDRQGPPRAPDGERRRCARPAPDGGRAAVPCAAGPRRGRRRRCPSAGLSGSDPAAGGLRRRGAFSPSLSVECSNQESLAAAPVSLFMIGDLRSALTERGSRAYSELAVHAGAAIGHAWLWATSVGMVGTAAGGVISGGLRRAAGMDGFNECPLLALNLGTTAGRENVAIGAEQAESFLGRDRVRLEPGARRVRRSGALLLSGAWRQSGDRQPAGRRDLGPSRRRGHGR